MRSSLRHFFIPHTMEQQHPKWTRPRDPVRPSNPSKDESILRKYATNHHDRVPIGRWSLIDLDQAFLDFVDEAEFVHRQSSWTLGSYRGGYRSFRKFLAERVTLTEPLGDQLVAIDGWMRWTTDREHPVSAVTLHTYWRNLRAFFTFLQTRYGLTSPFHNRKPPRLPDRIPRAKKPEECARILDAAYNYPNWSEFDRARAVGMLGVAMYAGLRRSEILKLHFADVDMKDGSLFVSRGKGRGGGKDRVVALAPDLRRILENYGRERRKANITVPEFFATRQRHQAVSLTTFRRIVKVVQRASGIPFTLHSLRHSFITQLLRSGVPIHTVSALAGHTQITTTAGYLSVWDEDKRDAVRGLRFR